MKLYLSSFKIGNRADELKNWITENDNKICLIPNALDSSLESKKILRSIEGVKELEELGFEVTVISLKDYFNNKGQLGEDLNDFHAFYVLGGNTFVLRQAMYLSGFDDYLKEIAKKPNYLYAGYSAGICILGQSLEGLDIVDDPTENPYNYDSAIYDGIGLLEYMPMPHYESDHPEAAMIDDEIKYCIKNNIAYKPLRDGDVILDEI